jgi:hypothetical protein
MGCLIERNAMRILASVVVLLVGLVATAIGCSCRVTDPKLVSLADSVTKELRDADVVFVGKVTSLRFSEEIEHLGSQTRYATFKVLRSWKGPETGTIEILTGNLCCTCGIPFDVDDVYIVYGYAGGDGTFSTNVCSRSSKIKRHRDPDEKILGKSRSPKKQR